jgi:TonB-dependent SusC/RagA subfamily outer membrane receptor
LFLFSFEMMAQLSIISNSDSARYQQKSADTKIRIRCKATSFSTEPLLIIDGLPVEFGKLRDIIPGEIESITVLKDNTATAIYGCQAINGVIIVTTKKARLRTFLIRDLLDRSRLQGATVSFISEGDKEHTLMFISNDSGVVTTDKLIAGAEYNMKITSAGYKTLSVKYKNADTTVNSFSLERDVISCTPVIVSADAGMLCRLPVSYSVQKISVCTLLVSKSISVGVYPNPVPAGQNMTIEVNSHRDGLFSVTVIAVDGRLLLSQTQKTYKDQNRFYINTDSRWPAGVYFIQIMDEKRNMIKLEKVIVGK